MNKGLVILPTFNERENIAKLIREILTQSLDLDILVVDDNSPDGTGHSVEELRKTIPQLFILHREKKEGLGRAYIAGFKWAVEHNYEYIFEMDADFSHQPKYLEDFLAAINDNDLIIGSRYIKGGGTEGWSKIREFISRFGCLYAKIILGLKINDLTGGFKCYRSQVLKAINLDKIESNGYMFQIEMTYNAVKKGFQVKEIPFIFQERANGRSKFNKKIIWEAVINCWRLRFFPQK